MYHVHKQGWDGLITGVPAGLVGVFSKPVVGALDAVAHLGGTVQEMAKYIGSDIAMPTQRRRYPSIFGPDRRLVPYNTYTSLGYHAIMKSKVERLDATAGLRIVAHEMIVAGGAMGEMVNMLNVYRNEDAHEEDQLSSIDENIAEHITSKQFEESVIFAAYFDKNIPHTMYNQLVVITSRKISHIRCEVNDTITDGFVEFKENWSERHKDIKSISHAKTAGEQYIKIRTTFNPEDDPTDRDIRSSSCREDDLLKRVFNVLQSLQGNY